MHNAIANPGHSQLLKFPTQKEIALSPAIWLAIGVLSYNHAILAKAPLRIIAPSDIVADLHVSKWQALEAGSAALADANALAPSSLNATLRICRALLEPLQVTVNLLGTAPPRQYLMLEFHGGEISSSFNLPDTKPRILPAHDFAVPVEPEDTTKEKAS